MIRLTPKFFLCVAGFLFAFFLLMEMKDFREAISSDFSDNGLDTIQPNPTISLEFLLDIARQEHDDLRQNSTNTNFEDNVKVTFVITSDLHDVNNTYFNVERAEHDLDLTKENFDLKSMVNSSFSGEENVTNSTDAVLVNINEAEVPGWEFNTTRNLQDYIDKDKMTASILPEHFCDQPSLLVIMVTTAPHKMEARMAIRESWGKDKKVLGYNVSIYYLMGQTDDTNVQEWVNYESSVYKDIIQENFRDTYNNLTIKSLSLLKLFNLVCSGNSQYVLKIDDDMFLSVPRLVAELAQRNESAGLIMGSVICDAGPIRDSSNKWYAPTYLFAESQYPRYASGTGYLMSNDAAEKIFMAALKTPIFHLEDVYLTGICSKKVGIKPVHNPFFTYRWLTSDICLFTQLITVHYQTPEGIRNIFNATTDPDVAERCAQSAAAFIVQKWMIQNVFMPTKDRRRRECS